MLSAGPISTLADLISGNGGYGIYDKQGFGNRISGNSVGVAADGSTPRGNGLGGILLEGHDDLIGSDADGVTDVTEANLIANNGGDGVQVSSDGGRNTILGNSIFDNGCVSCATDLGIDLVGANGATRTTPTIRIPAATIS